jgi:hypothetical protein
LFGDGENAIVEALTLAFATGEVPTVTMSGCGSWTMFI